MYFYRGRATNYNFKENNSRVSNSGFGSNNTSPPPKIGGGGFGTQNGFRGQNSFGRRNDNPGSGGVLRITVMTDYVGRIIGTYSK